MPGVPVQRVRRGVLHPPGSFHWGFYVPRLFVAGCLLRVHNSKVGSSPLEQDEAESDWHQGSDGFEEKSGENLVSPPKTSAKANLSGVGAPPPSILDPIMKVPPQASFF